MAEVFPISKLQCTHSLEFRVRAGEEREIYYPPLLKKKIVFLYLPFSFTVNYIFHSLFLLTILPGIYSTSEICTK